MDIHNLDEGTTAEDVAKAHAKDMETQKKYGVEYTKYWVNENGKKVFCLAHAPSAEAAEQVHREAHGLMPDKIIEIQPELAEGFLGGVETNAAGAAVFPGGGADARDPGIRTILFTDVVNSTTLTQSLGDEAALAILGMHDTIVRDALSALGGREVKHTGDGIMASFVSAAGAVRCAIQIQRELEKHAQANPSARSRSGSAPQPANLSNKTTISLDQRFNWPPVSALMRSRNKFWYRTQFQTYASAKDCRSKKSAKLPSKASVPQSALTRLHGSKRIRQSLSADPKEPICGSLRSMTFTAISQR